MADISKITLPSGTTYNLKDQQARDDIAAIESAISGGVTFMGETTTALTDGATTTTIVINGNNVTALKGYLVVYQSKEFVFDATKWIEMGDLSLIGDLGWKDSASGNFTPTGTVSQPTFTGSSSNVTITTADNNSGNYQPKGTVSQPTFTGSSTTSTGTFTPAGTIAVSVSSTSAQTATVSKASSGTATYTPAGTVSQPTFTGSSTTSTGSFTPDGEVSMKRTASGTATTGKYITFGATTMTTTTKSVSVSGTCAGSVAAPTISVKTAGSTTTVNSITAVGTLPEWTGTVANENLTIAWSAGTLPTKGSNTTVKTGDAAYQATAPTFTGGSITSTGSLTNYVTNATPVLVASDTQPSSGTYYELEFSGSSGNVSVTGTPSGTVSQPTFTGTGARLVTGNINVPSTLTGSFTGTQGNVSVTGTPSGTVSQPTFTGTKTQISGTVTPSGTVSRPTFTGTQGTVTVT